MSNRRYQDPILTKPLPSVAAPKWAVFLLFISLIAGCKYFFGNPVPHLWGAPPKNEYLHIMQQPPPPPIIIRPGPPAPIPPPAEVNSSVQARPLVTAAVHPRTHVGPRLHLRAHPAVIAVAPRASLRPAIAAHRLHRLPVTTALRPRTVKRKVTHPVVIAPKHHRLHRVVHVQTPA